jgi:hypothetical protein
VLHLPAGLFCLQIPQEIIMSQKYMPEKKITEKYRPLKYIALDRSEVQRLRSGGPDANGQHPEVSISDGEGNPCRYCLGEIADGETMLILAHRPFHKLQAYAELGPVFLCAKDCERHPEASGVPDLYRDREMLIRGYDHHERIVYGTGRVIDMTLIETEANQLFENDKLSFIHVRSPTNNCFHFRIE